MNLIHWQWLSPDRGRPLLAGLWLACAFAGALGQPANAQAEVAASASTSAATPAASASPAVVASRVGEVTLSIGSSEIQRTGTGQRQPVSKGSAIQPGDIIRTSASGHVHVRFIDGALLSVRPQSVLHVEEYRYDAAQPEQSLVKFYLETGTVREVSGRAAQLAKERFRLNTPLVAIGVRGTDFITQVSDQSTAVRVNQGAIVLTPLDDGCPASGFGPCQTSRSRELADNMGGMALIYRQSTPEPVLQPVNTLKGMERVTPMLQNKSGTGPDDVVSDMRNPDNLLNVIKPGNPLVWGRWARNTAPGDELTVPFAQAMEGRSVTVGDGYYFLFRTENGMPNLLAAASGISQFRLQGGAAQYRASSNDLSPAHIDRGTLGIDFNRNTFTTQLDVTVPGHFNETVRATGSIDRNTGIFLGDGSIPGTHVAGALSLDLNQAGYFFNKAVGYGAVSGATLWSRGAP